MSKTFLFFCCCLVVALGSRDAVGDGTGTFNDPFTSEYTDPMTGVVLVVNRWQSVTNDPPVVVGDTTYISYNIRQRDFSYIVKEPNGVPIFVNFGGEWNEYTSSSRTKTNANGNQDRIRDYLKCDCSTVASFPVHIQPGNVRRNDRYKWVHNYVESAVDINPSEIAGHLAADAFVDDGTTFDGGKKDFASYDFVWDRNAGVGGSWSLGWECVGPVDDFCGFQSGDWIMMPGFLGTHIYQKSEAAGALTNRLAWAFDVGSSYASDFNLAARDHPSPIPPVTVTPWTQQRLLKPAEPD